MNPLIQALTILSTIGFLWSLFNLIGALRDHRRMRVRHAEIEAEMAFLNERFDALFAEGRRCAAEYDREGYHRVLKALRVLEARRDREVTKKLKTKP